MHLEEKTISSEQIYDGKVVKLFCDKALIENGETVSREVIKHPGGVCIVALTTEDDVLFVRQFRYPGQQVLLEIPAGKLEWGESHFECGKRELLEETGCTAENYRYLGSLLPTPAYDTEIIHMYLATELTDTKKQHLDEDEFLDIEKIPLNKAVEMILNDEIKDAKTQIAIMKTKLLLGK